MAKLARKLVKLTFPQKLIKEPVIFIMAKKFDLTPNIRRARVTETVGEMVLEIDGEQKNLDKGLAYLTKTGIIVEPIVGDIVE